MFRPFEIVRRFRQYPFIAVITVLCNLTFSGQACGSTFFSVLLLVNKRKTQITKYITHHLYFSQPPSKNHLPPLLLCVTHCLRLTGIDAFEEEWERYPPPHTMYLQAIRFRDGMDRTGIRQSYPGTNEQRRSRNKKVRVRSLFILWRAIRQRRKFQRPLFPFLGLDGGGMLGIHGLLCITFIWLRRNTALGDRWGGTAKQ